MKHLILILSIFLIISGCGSAKDPSTPSDQDSLQVPSVPVPDTPANLKGISQNQKVLLSWDPVEVAESYNLYYSEEPGVDPSKSEKIVSVFSPYIHEGLAGKKTLYYRVTAVNTSGESASSEEKTVTPAQISLDDAAGLNVMNDAGWLVLLGKVKNEGDIPACEITLRGTIDVFTGRKEVLLYGGITGTTLNRKGLSDSACLRPGETGVFQIYTGVPHTIYSGKYTLEIEAMTDEIEDRTIRDNKLVVDNIIWVANSPNTGNQCPTEDGLIIENVQWEPASWDPEGKELSGNLLGDIRNLHQAETAYAVVVNLITYNQDKKVTGIYPVLISGNDCPSALNIPRNTCINPGGSASFSVMPWRSVPLPADTSEPLYIDTYEILTTHLEETDFQWPAEEPSASQ